MIRMELKSYCTLESPRRAPCAVENIIWRTAHAASAGSHQDTFDTQAVGSSEKGIKDIATTLYRYVQILRSSGTTAGSDQYSGFKL